LLTTSQPYFTSALSFLERRGITSSQALAAINFTEFNAYKKQQRVPADHYCALLDYGKLVLNEPFFGLLLGNEVQNSDYGVLGYVVESSDNLATAIKHLQAFDQLVANIGRIEFHINQQNAMLRWTPKLPCSEQTVLRNMTTWLTTTKQLLGEELLTQYPTPNYVALTHPFSSDQQAQLSEALCCPVKVNQRFNEIVFPSALLSHTFRGDNPQLHQTMVEISQQELLTLETNLDIKSEIIQLLALKPDLQDCTLVQFASLFNVSPRTLQRQLKTHHCRFATLLDNERKQRAMRQLGNISLGELSLQLGFNEQSSFNRAFKRWFNCSPRAYLNKDKT